MKISSKICTKLMLLLFNFAIVLGIVCVFSFLYTEPIKNPIEFYQKFKIQFIIGIFLGVALPISIIMMCVYYIKIDKLIIKIKKYRDFMLATNAFTIAEISQEFGESEEIVEKNIKEAIDNQILNKVYLSNKDKRIYILDSKNKTSNINLDYNYNLNMNIKEENKK